MFLITSGCSRSTVRNSAFTVRGTGGQTNLVLTPIASAVGRITSVNQQARIAVAAFPIGQVPPAGTRLAIFRSGQKVGELKMSNEAADALRVGDITAGTALEGDEVRAE